MIKLYINVKIVENERGKEMAITISIALQKGGTGKSTTAQALASTLSFKGKSVLLVDMDSQANVTYSSGIDEPEISVTDVLSGACGVTDAIVKCNRYDLLPADHYLGNVEREEEVDPYLLRDMVVSKVEGYDYIIIDTPPALGHLSFCSLVASDYIIIPIEPRPYALQGLSNLYDTIKTIKNSLNNNLEVLGILLIKYSNRMILNRTIKEELETFAEKVNTVIFDTTIREGIAVAEAQTVREPLIDYAKNSKPNIDYKGFTSEVLRMIEGVER